MTNTTILSDADPQRLREFADRLANWPEGRKRVYLLALFQLFGEIFPPRPRGSEQRQWFLAALLYAEAQKIVRLPVASGRCWDRLMDPAIPKFVERILPPKVPSPKPWQTRIWNSQLRWVAELPRMDMADYEFLCEVHKGLVNKSFNQMAPLKYRSFQLTGDEKRLGVLQRGALFHPKRLTLEMLGCAPEYPPLALENINDKPAILIFENAAPSRVAAQVLRGLTDAPYGMVGYGCGTAFVQSVRHLNDIRRPIEQIHYVGDIDRPGLAIAQHACENAVRDHLPAVLPAPGIHALMIDAVLKAGHPFGRPHDIKQGAGTDAQLVEWLPADVRAHVLEVLTRGNRIAEEVVIGPDELRLLWTT